MTFDPFPAPFNLAAHVLGRARSLPDKTALSVSGDTKTRHWTYAQLEGAIRGTATGLLNTGLAPQSRVLLRLGNTPSFPIAFLGCITAGLIPVPTSAQLTEPEITALSDDLRPSAIIADPDITLPAGNLPLIDTRDLAQFADLSAAPFEMGDPDRPAYIIFTSGTSGKPRGVIHAHRAIWARRMMTDGWYGMNESDRVLHAGAFNWTYTLGTGLMDPWTIGATALIPAFGTRPADFPALLERHQATIFAAAPGVYRQLLKCPVPAIPTLRHGLSAGEKLPETTRTAWTKATNTPIFEAFGMSECSTFISASPTNPAQAGTLGRPQPGRQVALLSQDGSPANSGEIAIHTSDPGLMLGYLDDTQATRGKFNGDWFLTGDIGTRTPSGDITYQGRTDDMMNAGGYRVSPIEVETALGQHPAISECAAVQLRVKSDTTLIAAFYTAPDVIDEPELMAHCATYLARYKCPRLFIHTPVLPRGANNKLLRRRLRETWERQNGQT